tara:strand:- start:17541 stop:18020 length:480 start_codon:yes stop_codon:yes gene_type:complete
METTNIGIEPTNLQAVANVLCVVLADEYILYGKTRNAHWNIEGPDFYSQHLFFETQYKELHEIIDKVAERIRTIGHYAPGRLTDILKLTHFTEGHLKGTLSKDFLEDLLHDHESLIMHLRGNIDQLQNLNHDLGSSDFLTGILEFHEKSAWMLRAHLKS